MKRSAVVTLTVLPALAAAACGSDAPDPCALATYNATACQYAVDHGGYYHTGRWIPHMYGSPFIFYSNGYQNYVAGGGRVIARPDQVYAVPVGASPPTVTTPSGAGTAGGNALGAGTTRGGFGGIGGGHSAVGA